MTKRNPSQQGKAVLIVAAGLAIILVAEAGWRRVNTTDKQIPSGARTTAVAVSNLNSLLLLPASMLQNVEIGRMNLLCAEGLPGAEGLEVDRALARLDEMAARVQSETQRHLYRFQRNPSEFANSEGYFRMIMLAVVLAEDFQVRYDPSKMGTATEARVGDGFFADSRDVFLHGLTSADPRGTCSSLPVLQVALGRRLGYPVKLVITKGHLFEELIAHSSRSCRTSNTPPQIYPPIFLVCALDANQYQGFLVCECIVTHASSS